ncbi:ABC transporter permease [Rhizobium laguerreae]|jgi:putative spermidine/putrescine transport system permease protein|uniref:ABC transporter permease n=1 Tax=Rhizobium laguerreae TaxID=1076926 RepID=UPI001C91EB9F|nr:ABC transporter permease [Rhizobium laguerreae]MBY3165681.1 ABC transporter permease [Rhizobium laguerreae]
MNVPATIGRTIYWVALVAILAFLIVPAVLVVVLSFSNDAGIAFPPATWGVNNYRTLIGMPSWGDAAMLSLGLATAAAVISTIVAVPGAFALDRTRLSRFSALPFLGILPLLVPQAAYAVGLYLVMAKIGLLGSFWGLAAAHVAVCFPFVFVIARSGLARLNPDLELVAMTLGATRLQAWGGITLRLLVPAMLSGVLFAFLTSFDEAVFSSFLSGPGLVTLPKAIFDSVRLGVDPVITAIATTLMVFTAILMGLASILRRKDTSS